MRPCCRPPAYPSDHIRVTHLHRNNQLQEEARCEWIAYDRKLPAKVIAEKYGRSLVTAYRWLKLWQAEDAADAQSAP